MGTTLCDPIDGSPPGSAVPGILQARTLEWAKTRLGADCGSDHELLIAKFSLKLKKVGKTTRPFRFDLNQIPYDYTVEVRNRFTRGSLPTMHGGGSAPSCWAFPHRVAFDSLPLYNRKGFDLGHT